MPDQHQEQTPPQHVIAHRTIDRDYIYRVALAFGIGTIFLLVIGMIWIAGNVLLIIFAGILFAVLLHGASNRLAKWLPLPHGASLALVLLLMVIILGSAGYFLAPRVAEQIDPLINTLPASLQRLRSYLEQYAWIDRILQTVPPAQEMLSNMSGVLMQARVFFSGVLGVIANFVIILFVGIYLAAQPHVYINGFLKIVPKRSRPHGQAVFQELGITLELWLFGKLLSMLVVGVASAIGLMLLGVPLAITLGVIAGLLDFIPYLGPILAGVPAILMAFSESPTTALYVFFLFVAIQSGESYLLQPLVERQTVSLPPALTITMQMLFAVPFGLLGVALASPLTAVLFVLIAMLYVRDVLDDPVETPGEQHQHSG
jgi:predicted PurR-regulated permease PerM